MQSCCPELLVVPAPSQRHEHCYGVLEALRDILQICDGRLVVLHVARQHVQVGGQASAVINLQQLECIAGSVLCFDLCL